MELDKRESDFGLLLDLRERIGALSREFEGLDTEPKGDLIDLGHAFELVLEVPGVMQEQLEVSLDERSVTVAGYREPPEETLDVIKRERTSGHFQRTVELPNAIEREESSAHLHHGLLTLHLPKRKA